MILNQEIRHLVDMVYFVTSSSLAKSNEQVSFIIFITRSVIGNCILLYNYNIVFFHI